MAKKKLHNSSVISRKSDLLFSNMDDEVVMMNIEKGEYYGLDEIGSRIWQIIENPVTLDELIQVLVEEYDVDRETCRIDVVVFIEELRKKDLVNIR